MGWRFATYHRRMRSNQPFCAVNSSITPEGDTLTRPEVSDGGDHDKFAHYVRNEQIT